MKEKIELSHEEALVLSHWLSRNSEKKELFEHISEQYVLWKIEAQLEPLLPELFCENYFELLEKARKTSESGY